MRRLHQVSPLVLAYIGDSVYELYVTGSLSLATTPGTEAHVEWGNTRTIATINIYDIFENTFALLYGG